MLFPVTRVNLDFNVIRHYQNIIMRTFVRIKYFYQLNGSRLETIIVIKCFQHIFFKLVNMIYLSLVRFTRLVCREGVDVIQSNKIY